MNSMLLCLPYRNEMTIDSGVRVNIYSVVTSKGI